MELNPPFESICNKFSVKIIDENDTNKLSNNKKSFDTTCCVDCELPLIDISHLYDKHDTKLECGREIADAAKEWGFFQIVNHGISRDVLKRVQSEQRKFFQVPFENKANDDILSSNRTCYRWGNPTAMSLEDFSWSEAFHMPLSNIYSLSSPGLEEFTEEASKIAKEIARILAEKLLCSSSSSKSSYNNLFAENCELENSSYVRMNRYPPCPIFPNAYGLVPHTDSDFLTVLYQDQLGGLQLLRNGHWINVKPIQDALIVNVGDLFEAWSNGYYKSIKHRVVSNPVEERMSIAHFLCPSYETVIQSYCEPSLYRKFSFYDYKKQIQEDVKSTGNKIGLSRFLI